MNVARLINEVYKRNGIWDHRTSCHYMRDAVASLWCEIAEELEAPVDAVKAKWRNLRDTYTAECRKMYKRYRDKEPLVKSKWVWFSAMDFLRPHLKRLREFQEAKNAQAMGYPVAVPLRNAGAIANRRMKKILKLENEAKYEDERLIENAEVDLLPSESLLEAVTYLEEDENGTVITDAGDDERSSGEIMNSFSLNYSQMTPNSTNNTTIGNSRKRPWQIANITGSASSTTFSAETDRKRAKRLLKEEEITFQDVDDTYHFLISLREPLKSLSIDRQMYVRYKIQELLFNETNEHQKHFQTEPPEHVETTPEIISIGNIKLEPPN